jgi:hypothetical protein
LSITTKRARIEAEAFLNDGTRFNHFYRTTFLTEHRHPMNVALHCVGVLGGLAFLAGALLSPWRWAALLAPLVHAAPGLLGHRWFERSEAVGDLRVTRRDFPLWWFLVANHLLAWDVLRGRAPSRATSPRRPDVEGLHRNTHDRDAHL